MTFSLALRSSFLLKLRDHTYQVLTTIGEDTWGLNIQTDFCFCLISAEFDNYEFGKMLGAGGFGQVISATQKRDNLPVC